MDERLSLAHHHTCLIIIIATLLPSKVVARGNPPEHDTSGPRAPLRLSKLEKGTQQVTATAQSCG